MSERKGILLRLDPAVHDALARWAADELRSTNAQIEFLLRRAKDSGAETPSEFSSELGLTSREGEVLSWLSKGKTNRDIAQILGLSPRTVDKHRSTNAQIEFLLRRALADAGRLPSKAGEMRRPGRPRSKPAE